MPDETAVPPPPAATPEEIALHAAPTAPRPDASGMLRGDTEAQARAVVARTCAGVTGLVCQPRAGLGLVARRP